MRTIFQWLRWVCLLLLGLAWTTTPSFAAVGALNQANGGVTIRYDATEAQNRGYDAEPLRAWDNNPPEMVDASAFFGPPAQFLAAKTAPSFFEGASYTPKVLKQMQGKVGEFHSFPESVTAFESAGTVRSLTGGDKVVRQVLEIPGSYGSGGNGVFRFIKNADGTINERLFVPNSP